MRQRSNLIILFGLAFLLVGGAIVWLIVSDGDADSVSSAADGEARTSVLVAKDNIPANTVGADAIEQGLLETKEIPSANLPSGAVGSPDLLENSIFAVEVGKGTTINSSQLATRSIANIQVPDGFDGVAVQVDYTNGGAGYIAPGDRINLYGVYGEQSVTDGGISAPGTPAPRTELALTNVEVLWVDRQSATVVQAAAGSEEPAAAPAAGGSLTYFLALTPNDVERVVQLSTFADLYLSLTAEDAPAAGDTPGADGTTVNGPVSANSAAQPAA